MTLQVRPGCDADLRAAAALLNDIIAIGGTTALTTPVSGADLRHFLQPDAPGSTWHVALSDAGDLLGFQWVAPHADLPPEACDIATFVKLGQTGLGVGSRLFEATAQAALDLGYGWINANIRADNTGGLTYYQSRGFRDRDRLENTTLADGTRVDKILKRYDLKD